MTGLVSTPETNTNTPFVSTVSRRPHLFTGLTNNTVYETASSAIFPYFLRQDIQWTFIIFFLFGATIAGTIFIVRSVSYWYNLQTG